MTVTRRITAAERSVSGADTGDHTRLLVELCGRRDALFWPWRSADTAVGVIQRRRKYLDGTEGTAAKADGRSSWRPSHEARRRLVADGTAEARMASGQVSSLFVTERGDATARAIIGDMPGPSVIPLLLARLLTADGHREFCGRRWLSESALFGRECLGNPQDWDDCTALMLPLLVRGIADSRCDTWGRIYYTTDFDATTELEPQSVEVEAEANPDAWGWYIAAFRAERDFLRTAEPDDGAEIVIPIPATL